MDDNEKKEILEKLGYIKNICNEVLDDFNSKKLSLEQMKARMELLSKMMIQLESKLDENVD